MRCRDLGEQCGDSVKIFVPRKNQYSSSESSARLLEELRGRRLDVDRRSELFHPQPKLVIAAVSHPPLTICLASPLELTADQLNALSKQEVSIASEKGTDQWTATILRPPTVLVQLFRLSESLPVNMMELRIDCLMTSDFTKSRLSIEILNGHTNEKTPTVHRCVVKGKMAMAGIEHVPNMILRQGFGTAGGMLHAAKLVMNAVAAKSRLERTAATAGEVVRLSFRVVPTGDVFTTFYELDDPGSKNGELYATEQGSLRNHIILHKELFAVLLMCYLYSPLDMCHDYRVEAAKSASEVFDRVSDKESLANLAARLVPALSGNDIVRLTTILVDAQTNPPADKAAFVRQVNELLDVLALRIRTADGSTGRLRLAPNGSIQVTKNQHKGTGAFKSADFTLVRVPRTRAGNRYTSPDANTGPS